MDIGQLETSKKHGQLFNPKIQYFQILKIITNKFIIDFKLVYFVFKKYFD